MGARHKWLDGYDNNSGRKTGRRSYTFPSKGSRSNASPRDKLIKRERGYLKTKAMLFKFYTNCCLHWWALTQLGSCIILKGCTARSLKKKSFPSTSYPIVVVFLVFMKCRGTDFEQILAIFFFYLDQKVYKSWRYCAMRVNVKTWYGYHSIHF